jgi:hypothetical protein
MKHFKNLLLFFLVFFLFIEVIFRSYYAVQFQQSTMFWIPANGIEHFYPGILAAQQDKVTKERKEINILLLGASVLHPYWGNVEEALKKKVEKLSECPVKIHNLAISAHSSLDSRIKYELLSENAYDFVIFYNGINETRFNLCPKEVFKEDYSHLAYYKSTLALSRPLSKFSIFPFLVADLSNLFQKHFSSEEQVSLNSPLLDSLDKAWLNYGKEVKTQIPFANNLKRIQELSKQSQSTLIISSFAYYIPENYTYDAFLNKQLDYGQHLLPIELWGKKEYVQQGIEAHNAILASIKGDHTYFVDANASIEKNAVYFNDICHLSPEGCVALARLLAQPIREELAKLRSKDSC